MRDISPVAAIEISDLRFAYEGNDVLEGIDLTVPPGQIFAYLGPNGAGKTTTVRVLIGMLQGFRGTVRVAGIDVRKDPLGVKSRIGYVPESAALYEELTPLEFLEFIGRVHRMDTGLAERKSKQLLGLLGLRGQMRARMSSFSKGMRQKVLLIAAMLHNPEVLFLDEPLSGLDANTALTVKEILTQLSAQGKTIFYCSHVLDVVERLCHRLVIINEGRIIADGTFEELKEQSREGTLEHIFTRLTSDGSEDSVAGAFVEVLGEE